MTGGAQQPEISVIVPCFRSGAWLDELVARIQAALDTIGRPHEIILVNDGSDDDTWEAILRAARGHASVRGIDLLGNTGQHRATICGLEHAAGSILITIDDDLQQPPEAIGALVDRLEGNSDADCVFASFEKKRHGPLRNLGTRVMGRLFEWLYHKPRGLRTTAFRALRRELADAVCSHATMNPNLNPLIFQTTRRLDSIEVRHEWRAGGRSGYGWIRLLRLLLDNVLTVSTLPLKCVSLLGLMSAVGAFFLGLFYLVRHLIQPFGEPGFATIVLLIIFFGGMTLFSIGLLGEYIIRIMDEVRRRPRYIVRRETGEHPAPQPADESSAVPTQSEGS